MFVSKAVGSANPSPHCFFPRLDPLTPRLTFLSPFYSACCFIGGVRCGPDCCCPERPPQFTSIHKQMAAARQDSQLLPKNNKQSSVCVSGLSPSVSPRHTHVFPFFKKQKTSIRFISAPLLLSVPSSLLPSASLTPASVGPDR